MKKPVFLFLSLLIIGLSGFARQKYPTYDVVAGFGLPEAFHIGCKMHAFERSQFGLYYGNILNSSDGYSYHSLYFDHHFHFGEISRHSKRPVFFFRQGVIYALDNSPYAYTHYLFGSLSLGREFNISRNIGLCADLGISKVLFETETVKDPDQKPWLNLSLQDFFILPLVRFQIFYSF